MKSEQLLMHSHLFFFCIIDSQDPTEQTKIDNYMVQELDGTVNEWGWCKQKVWSWLVFVGYNKSYCSYL